MTAPKQINMTDELKSDAAIMELSLCAVADVDITEQLYARFFAAHPEQQASFYHPSTSQGQMVNEILEALIGLAQGELWVEDSVRGQIITHRSHGDIPFPLYGELLELLITCLADAAGDRWLEIYQAAWDRQTARLIQIIAHDF